MKKIVTIVLTIILLIILTNITKATTQGIINTETARVRSEASTDSSILALASMSETVEIIEETGDWYKVNYGDVTGYIRKDLVDVEGAEEVETEETSGVEESSQEEIVQESTSESDAVEENNTEEQTLEIIDGYVANLEVDVTIKIVPSINSTNIATIISGTQITVIEVINNWCHIETVEDSGWIRIETLTAAISTTEQEEEVQTSEQEQAEEVEETVETMATAETSTTRVGYVNVNAVNVRKETSIESEIVAILYKNDEVTILGEENNWYKIEVDGITGYIAETYISDEQVAEVTSRGTNVVRTSLEETATEETISESNVDLGSQVVEYAKQFLGYKYVSGGASPSVGFDCSGYTYYVYKNFGITLSKSSASQKNAGTSVAKSDLQLGDLLIFNNDANTSIGHVGIYIGENQFIHAANPSSGVKITSLSDEYYVKRYVDARRVL